MRINWKINQSATDGPALPWSQFAKPVQTCQTCSKNQRPGRVFHWGRRRDLLWFWVFRREEGRKIKILLKICSGLGVWSHSAFASVKQGPSVCAGPPSGQQQQQQHRLRCVWERQCDGRTGTFPQLQRQQFLSGGHGGRRQKSQLWRPQEEEVSPVSLVSSTARLRLRATPTSASCPSLLRYVKLCVLPEKSSKLKTAVKKHTTDPVFNEVLKVNVIIWIVYSLCSVVSFVCFAVSHRAPPAVWETTPGLRVAFKDPETKNLPRWGPHPPGRLEVRGRGFQVLQLVSAQSEGETTRFIYYLWSK